jgi:hypothetical protein
MPRFTASVEFDTEEELLAYLGRHAPAGAMTGPGAPPPAPEAAPAPMRATPVGRPRAQKAETAPAEESPATAAVKAQLAEEDAAAKVKAEAPVPTPEQVSAAIIKFLPNPEAKAAAARVLADFGVQRGKDLKPEQRAPFLAALGVAGAAFGI